MEMLAGEKWLLESGLVSQSAVDNLLGYAYMQPGVEKVELEFDFKSMSVGLSPVLTFKMKLQRKIVRRQKRVKSLIGSKSIFAKLYAIFLLRYLKTPPPGMIEQSVKTLAQEYLPPNYKVEVHVE